MTVWDSLVGQRHVVATLSAAARGEGMTHAWLFTGPPGSGRSNAAIAAALVVTEKAVGKHINNIFAKLDLPQASDDNRRVLAVLQFLQAT